MLLKSSGPWMGRPVTHRVVWEIISQQSRSALGQDLTQLCLGHAFLRKTLAFSWKCPVKPCWGKIPIGNPSKNPVKDRTKQPVCISWEAVVNSSIRSSVVKISIRQQYEASHICYSDNIWLFSLLLVYDLVLQKVYFRKCSQILMLEFLASC